MSSTRSAVLGLALLPALMVVRTPLQQEKPATYTKDIAPIITDRCLPCHLEANENPSGLALDTYETLMKGGEHGSPIVPGKPMESLLYQKLLDEPPFGKRMPRNKKPLTQDQIDTIVRWISAGATK